MNLFIYGTLKNKNIQQSLKISFKKEIEYEYIKGYKLIEISLNGIRYLSIVEGNPDDIISGNILIGLDEKSIEYIKEYEGEEYVLKNGIISEVNKINCSTFIKNIFLF